MFGLGKGAGKVVGEALGGVGKILDGVLTSSEERGKIDIEFNKLQTEINKLEAGSASLFVSGWRPMCGWICSFGVGFNYILRPLLNYVLAIFLPLVKQMDSLDMSQLMPLLMGMLGFGALRSYEKIKGKNRN
tara:strand:+ start:932 stop:1327 length:396 start_codon:yes stop_codon:yes gene_type:complete